MFQCQYLDDRVKQWRCRAETEHTVSSHHGGLEQSGALKPIELIENRRQCKCAFPGDRRCMHWAVLCQAGQNSAGGFIPENGFPHHGTLRQKFFKIN
jgi:hypothetical protein